MAENKNNNLPTFDSLDALTKFFDENDMGDYAENMPEADFEVSIDRRMHFVAVDEDVAERLSEISKTEHLSSGAIVNSWLREKISDYSHK